MIYCPGFATLVSGTWRLFEALCSHRCAFIFCWALCSCWQASSRSSAFGRWWSTTAQRLINSRNSWFASASFPCCISYLLWSWLPASSTSRHILINGCLRGTWRCARDRARSHSTRCLAQSASALVILAVDPISKSSWSNTSWRWLSALPAASGYGRRRRLPAGSSSSITYEVIAPRPTFKTAIAFCS